VFFLSCLLTSLAGIDYEDFRTAKCGKTSIEHMVPVGDHPNHSFGVTQGSCTWSKPWMIAGVASKEGVGTDTLEADGEVAKTRGMYVDTMACHQFAIKTRLFNLFGCQKKPKS